MKTGLFGNFVFQQVLPQDAGNFNFPGNIFNGFARLLQNLKTVKNMLVFCGDDTSIQNGQPQ